MTFPYALAFAVGTPLTFVALFFAAQRALAPPGDARGRPGEAVHGAPPRAARAVLEAGYVFGVLAVSAAVVAGCVHGVDLGADLAWTAAFGGSAIALLFVTARLGARVIVRRRLDEELERGNIAVAIAVGAHYAATAILLARCLYGDDLSTLGVSIAFFAVAQATLHALLLLFRALTAYDDYEEIVGGNVAAALSYAGVAVSLALIVGHAADGTFAGWGASLVAYGRALLFAVALYPVRQIVVQAVVLRGGVALRRGRLDVGIGRERDVGLGALEASAYLATAFFVSRIAG
jgi:uncharacterized membrane protein YjfL (UPF0719 family)